MKIKKSIKKSYNPFKMLGSYIGVIIAIILFYLKLASHTITTSTPGLIGAYIEKYSWFYINPFSIPAYNFVFWVVIGFILGWGINSLIRKYNSKGRLKKH